MRPVLAAGKYPNVKEPIAGYNDGFVNTSPVDSFAVRRFGLCDMGGNVLQWCEDWYDTQQKDRVLRGASWNSYNRESMLSPNRLHGHPGDRFSNRGFRCVLVFPGS